MPLSDVTHATVEQVDAAIETAKINHEGRLAHFHASHLHVKAVARAELRDKLNKLRRYRDALAAEQTGGGE